jgi:hypothetical protein
LVKVSGHLYASQKFSLKMARSGIEWNSGQKVALQHPL